MHIKIIHPDGWKFIAIFSLISIILSFLSITLMWIGIVLTLWCVYFFRNPIRITPKENHFLISPADGKVTLIKKVVPPKNFKMPLEETYRISVFLNVFDVHINKLPMSGIIENIIYHPGKFLNASLDKASEDNERNTLIIKNTENVKIAVTQIAGLIARRIVCYTHEGEEGLAGKNFGLIRFGSRVDIYLPSDVEPLVIEGQRVIAGETILANLQSKEKRRQGEVRM